MAVLRAFCAGGGIPSFLALPDKLLQASQILGELARVPSLALDLHTLHIPEEIHHQPFAPSLAPGKKVPAYPGTAVDLALIITIEKVAQGQFGGRRSDLGFEEVEIVVGPAVDNGNTDVIVGVVGVRRLVDFGATGGDDVWGVET